MINEYSLEIGEDYIPYLKVVKEHDFQSHMEEFEEIEEAFRTLTGIDTKLEEHMYMLGIRGRLFTGLFQLAQGEIQEVTYDKTTMLTRLLLSGSTSFALVHNHSNGDIDPSPGDYGCYTISKHCAEMIGIKMTDFAIITRDDYFSYAENDLHKQED